MSSLRRILALAFLLISTALACAHMKDDTTVCPEYRDLRCMTKEDCTMDTQRNCQVCRCTPANTIEQRPVTPDDPDSTPH